MARIFISHSSRDNDSAIRVRDWLYENGWRDEVFLDLDPKRGIATGESWEAALQKAAHRCEAVLALVSPDWLASPWCKGRDRRGAIDGQARHWRADRRRQGANPS